MSYCVKLLILPDAANGTPHCSTADELSPDKISVICIIFVVITVGIKT